ALEERSCGGHLDGNVAPGSRHGACGTNASGGARTIHRATMGYRMSKHLHHARRLSTLAAIGGLAIVLGLVPATAAAADPITVADCQLPPQDAAGWSRLAPSADSRLLYVDSRQGDDGNGKVYLP